MGFQTYFEWKLYLIRKCRIFLKLFGIAEGSENIYPALDPI